MTFMERVRIERDYISRLMQTETIFDMAAVCYEILNEELDNQTMFVSKYLDTYNGKEKNVKNNPNIGLLTRFFDEVSALLQDYPKSTFEKKKQIILNKMQQIELWGFEKRKENMLTIVFTLLSAIDSAVPLWKVIEMEDRQALNKGNSQKRYFVYPVGRGMDEDLIYAIGRERKATAGIDENLTNLIILDRSRLPRNAGQPKLNYLSRKANGKIIRVAIIAGMDGGHFTTLPLSGSSEGITYIEEKQEQVGNLICRQMHAAIEKGAEFIILPEFCGSEEILKIIRTKLKEWKQDGTMHSKLIAVFPGSTWVRDNDNVQYLLDACGRDIGQHYKNAPFRKRKEGVGYEITEALTHPGLRSTLLYINNLGYVLPATCRDVIDGTYTDYYVEKFTPTLLMVPAWSSSGGSFEKPLKRYSADYFTNSVFCNGCGALRRNSTIIGGASVIGRKKTTAAGVYLAIKKRENCTNPCSNMCTYMLNIGLSWENTGTEGRITYQLV